MQFKALCHAGVAIGALACLASPVRAEEATDPPAGPVALAAEYRLDAVAVAQGARAGLRYVDYLSLAASADLDAALGWKGARLYVQGLASSGQAPNGLAGTLQGINNDEVEGDRAKLFQAYLEQDLDARGSSLRVGFSDLNSEFYLTEASGMLLAPAFGIGSELSATGPNGPSIFPSTALGTRLRLAAGGSGYVQAAAVDARSGVLGDRGGISRLFGHGALLIAEAGEQSDEGKLAAGAWTYSQRQDDLTDRDAAGQPLRRRAHGAYVLAQRRLADDGERSLDGFLRVGLSDGRTTPYAGGWQAGLLLAGAFAERPESTLSFGVNAAQLSRRYRQAERSAGQRVRRQETGFELAYSDRIAPWLTVQPDIQYVRSGVRAPGVRDAVVATLRLVLAPVWP